MHLNTNRLHLREFEDEDFAAIHEYAADPEATRPMDWGPNTPEETRALIERVRSGAERRPRSLYIFGVTLPAESNRLIGHGGLFIHAESDRAARLGYILHPHYWGRGLASELTQALVRFGFDQLSLHRIEATVVPGNAASIRVLEKAGFTQEGRLRESKFVRGEFRDNLLFAALASDRR